jgi:hypothetical protein
MPKSTADGLHGGPVRAVKDGESVSYNPALTQERCFH